MHGRAGVARGARGGSRLLAVCSRHLLGVLVPKLFQVEVPDHQDGVGLQPADHVTVDEGALYPAVCPCGR